ncbi:SAM-dependent methyltransferase [Streptomyces sp. O3]
MSAEQAGSGSPAHDTDAFYEIANQLVMELWDENFHQGYWETAQDDRSNRAAADRMTDLLAGKSGLTSGTRMLDVGCGIGLPAIRVAETTAAEIVGVSNNQAQIDEASRRAAERGLSGRVSFAYADAEAMPYADGAFDVVWALETLPHLDRARAFAELRRVLKPGGRLVLTDFLLRAPLVGESKKMVEEFEAGMQGNPRLLLDEYRALLLASGLELEELSDISDHTANTARRVTAAVNERFDELTARYGQEIAPMLEVFRHPVGTLPEMGYLLAVARNPA